MEYLNLCMYTKGMGPVVVIQIIKYRSDCVVNIPPDTILKSNTQL